MPPFAAGTAPAGQSLAPSSSAPKPLQHILAAEVCVAIKEVIGAENEQVPHQELCKRAPRQQQQLAAGAAVRRSRSHPPDAPVGDCVDWKAMKKASKRMHSSARRASGGPLSSLTTRICTGGRAGGVGRGGGGGAPRQG